MVMVGSGAQDRIDRLLLLEHHPEVFVISHLVVWGLFLVMLLDLVTERETPGRAIVVKLVQILNLDGVSHSDNLHIRLWKESPPNIGLALAAATHNRNVYLFTGRYELRPTQHMARDKADPRRGNCRAGDEFASSQAGLGLIFLFHK